MKKQIVRISVLQSSKIIAALYGIMGLLYSIAGLIVLTMTGPEMRTVGIVYLFGPIWMAVLGFVGFTIFAAIYNALAQAIGGVEIEVGNIED